jgi:hypothetical protein
MTRPRRPVSTRGDLTDRGMDDLGSVVPSFARRRPVPRGPGCGGFEDLIHPPFVV